MRRKGAFTLVFVLFLQCLFAHAGQFRRWDPFDDLAEALARASEKPGDCPWLPETINLTRERGAENRRQYFRRSFVDRYVAAAKPGPATPELADKIADEVADFLYNLDTRLSDETIRINETILDNPDADPLTRLVAMRVGRSLLLNAAQKSSHGKEVGYREAKKQFEQERLDLCRQALDMPLAPFARFYAARTAGAISNWFGNQEESGKFADIKYDSFIGCMQELQLKEPDKTIMLNWLQFYAHTNNYHDVNTCRYISSLFAKQSMAFRKKYMHFITACNGCLAIHEAWLSRGGTWASEVEAENWPAFREKKQEAATLLEGVYPETPDNLQIAAGMLEVTLGHGRESMIWFKRGVDSCFDHMPLYSNLLWGMRPRWGGSHPEMLVFGRQCLNTGRFDTRVPYVFADSIFDVASETGPRWRAVFRNEPVKKALVEMYEGYLNEPEQGVNRGQWLVNYAHAMFLCGDYAEAKRLYESAPPAETDEEKVFGFTWLLPRTRLHWLPKAIDIFLDERGEKLREADTAEVAGRLPRAIDLFIEALSSFPDDPDAAWYIRTRLGECMSWRRDRDSDVGKVGDRWRWLFESKGGRESPAVLLAIENHLRDLTVLLEHGLDPDSGYPLLFYAVSEAKSAKMVETLLKHGANPHGKANGAPLALYAVASDDPAIVELFMEKGADLSGTTSRGKNALHLVAENNSRKLLPLVADDTQLDINLRTNIGKTPLYLAVENKHPEMAEQLLQRGADPEIAADKGFHPIHIAVHNNDAAMVEILVKGGANIEAKTSNRMTPLEYACDMKNIAAMKTLLRLGADPNTVEDERPTLLCSAVQVKHSGMMALLLEHGADTSIPDSRGFDPLLTAIFYKYKEGVELLLKHGADVNTENSVIKFAPLHLAVEEGNPEILELILEAKPDINAQDAKGNTPLMLAVIRRRNDIAKMLIGHGADAGIADSRGVLPLQAARNTGNEELVSLLQTDGAAAANDLPLFHVILFAAVAIAVIAAVIWKYLPKSVFNRESPGSQPPPEA